MSDTNEQVVSTNEYGLSDEEYARERKAARAAIRGQAPAAVETQPSTETAETVETAETPETAENDGKQETKSETDKGPAVEEAVPDFLKDIPEEFRDKVASQLKAARDESEYHKKRYDSDIGRINAYQSKYEEARRALAKKESEIAALKKAPPKPLKESDDPRIKQALETGDEDSVELMEALRAELRKEFESEFRARDELQAQYEVEAASRQQLQAVEDFDRKVSSKFENWREVVYAHDDKGAIVLDEHKSPAFNDGWLQFVYDQPPTLRNAILNIGSADDAIWAIDSYGEWLRKKGYVQEDAPQTAQATIPNADAIQKKRDEDLKRKTPPAGHQPGLAPSPTLDLDKDPELEKKARQLARKALRENDPSIYSIQNLQR